MVPQLRGAGIIGIGSYAPPKVLTNADLEKIVETTDEWILTRTGIRERRVVSEGEAASDLAIEAAKRAIESARLSPEKIDLVICATITGDMPFPSTACLVQNAVGAVNAAAFDLQACCSGWVYSLSAGSQFIRAGTYEHVLVVGVDVLSSVTDWTDRSTCVLFGDAAGAVVLGPTSSDTGVLSSYLGADGSGSELLKIEAGGSKLPTTEETVRNRKHFIKMEGREVFKFSVRVMCEAAIKALDMCGLTPADIDLFVPHQANMRIIESGAARLGLPDEKVFTNLRNYGNTSAASIPLALDQAYRSGRVKEGDVIVAVGFGGGLTWAATVIKWILP
ncbi:MAG TPA: beta-ketoacyl-ACP synthase III [Armatimonadota bacterium]|nr:beta-ketoacyl-ACP synthase III [Armatimonadota bacterium]